MIKALAENYDLVLNLTAKSNKLLSLHKEEQVGWEPPEEGWIKLNVDGSVLQPGSRGACGGLSRNFRGRMLVGFSMNIGTCTLTMAELWAIYIGIKMAVELGINKLNVESDSRVALSRQ
ncbi:Putative ribonuclease H protein [Arachis hypogaea]|nr:Putative ribonuclease H protein [Arachis hypogaea]